MRKEDEIEEETFRKTIIAVIVCLSLLMSAAYAESILAPFVAPR